MSLRECLEQQRQLATSSLDHLQQHSQDRSTQLHSTASQLAGKLREANVSVRELSQAVVTVRAERDDLITQLSSEKEMTAALTAQLQERSTALCLIEQKLEQLQMAIDFEQQAKSQLQSSFTEEREGRLKTESSLTHSKHRLSATARELSQLHARLAKERSRHEHIRTELALVEGELMCTKQALDTEREAHHTSRRKTVKELASTKQKCHNEKKLLKEKIVELQNDLKMMRAESEGRGEEAARLAAAHSSLRVQLGEAEGRLAHTQQALEERQGQCDQLEARVQSLDGQVSQLSVQLDTMGQVRLEFDEYKRKLEANSRVGMQRVVAEVTGLMEQQHCSHQYLEKLRSENEAIASDEKNRQIGHLKDELKEKNQETKQSKIHIKQLELEAEFLRSHGKNQERSRRRLESRLEHVNTTLNKSYPPPGTSSFPLHSTPRSSVYYN